MNSELEQRIGYSFADKALLTLALTHRSLQGQPSNQRLEFLGDAVLGALIADLLYRMFPDEAEGALARRQAALVRGETLSKLAEEIGLPQHLRMGASEKRGGRGADSHQEDALEALIGALYLDGGLEAARRFIEPRMRELALERAEPPKDAKTSLQEWAQGKGLPVPAYCLLASEGPAHAPLFTVEVQAGGKAARASAPSKRAAEQAAAAVLLKDLG